MYVNWKPITYTIKFNKNDDNATGTMSDLEMTYDVSKNLTNNSYVKTGYTFIEWNTAKDGSGTSYKNNESVENLKSTNGAEITLYAIWKDVTSPVCSITKTLTNSTSGVSVRVDCYDEGSGCTVSSTNYSGLKSSKTYTILDNDGNSTICTAYISGYCDKYESCEDSACGQRQAGYCTCKPMNDMSGKSRIIVGTCNGNKCDCQSGYDWVGGRCYMDNNTCPTPSCGVESYNTCETPGCGCKTYKYR